MGMGGVCGGSREGGRGRRIAPRPAARGKSRSVRCSFRDSYDSIDCTNDTGRPNRQHLPAREGISLLRLARGRDRHAAVHVRHDRFSRRVDPQTHQAAGRGRVRHLGWRSGASRRGPGRCRGRRQRNRHTNREAGRQRADDQGSDRICGIVGQSSESMKASPDHYAVIMAGGGGERFWPMSRMRTPKQLLALVTERTLIEETVARIEPVFPRRNILIITNTEQASQIHKLLPKISRKNIIAEPMRRDTAAAVALGAVIVAKRNPNAVMAVLPADHVINEPARYRRVLANCLKLAGHKNVLVTIGIKPTEPNTGYGYIEAGRKLGAGFWNAKRFVEKPDLATAKKYVANGRYRWNAGMFVWSVKAVSEALTAHMPELFCQLQTLRPAIDTPRFDLALRRLYPKLQRVSIDYGPLEKAP